jgi:hypothetical protein
MSRKYVCYKSGYDLYAIIRHEVNFKAWDGSVYVSYDVADWLDYIIPLTDEGGDIYSFEFEDSGLAIIYEQGSIPAYSDSIVSQLSLSDTTYIKYPAVSYESGHDVHCFIRRESDLKVWNGSEYVDFVLADIDDYKYDLTDVGGDLYSTTTMPTVGDFVVIYYDNELLLGISKVRYTGSITLNSDYSIDDADEFFNNRLTNTYWSNASDDDKIKALNMAIRAINQLNFDEDLIDDDYDSIVFEAACLIAVKYLEGYEVDQIRENQTVVSQTYSNVKEIKNNVALDYYSAGIVSAEAWDLLIPYFKNSTQVRLNKVT